jgi:Helitron helicase-like domain at N-terminus
METLNTLQTVLRCCHPFTDVYQQAFQLTRETSLQEYRLQLNFRQGSDHRRYNLPTATNELALIIPGDEDSLANSQDIIIRPRGGPLKHITECHPAYITLHFPLLLPTGQLSWTPNIAYTSDTASSSRHVSLCDYHKFRLHSRPPRIESPHFFQAGQLFQELLVHAWASAENSRLAWVRYHQKDLRAELYNGVVDALHDGVDVSSIGKKVVLPASFTSGPRFMQRNLQNALALLRKFGGSDLFITFTANPHWREIEENLLPNQAPSDRPDLIARMFNLKFESLLHDIMCRKIFGKAVGYVYTVEYQKRGLPHVHLIVFLHRSCRLSSPDVVDDFISTEFPDKNLQPRLFALVKKFMVHGPCGPGVYSPCLDEHGRCTKNHPKPFRSVTEMTGDSYVQTRRRDTGRFIPIGNHFVDNRSVISYSPYLTLRYEAHINVECTAGLHAIKYIYKVRIPIFLPHHRLHAIYAVLI